MSDQPKESEFGKAFRERLEKELVPQLTNPKISLRSAVAVNIMAVVDRQIGQGDPDASKEWSRLRDVVKVHPGAEAMVTELEAAVRKYEEDLHRQIAAGADEGQVRKAAAAIIKMAIMAKMKGPKPEADGEAAPGDEAVDKAPAQPKAES
jgi:hypothetical protein